MAETEAHFARQLTALGWTRREGGAQGLVAWSWWGIPDELEREGLLLILENAVLPRYIVHLRKVKSPSSEPIGVGGAVSIVVRPITAEEEPPPGE